MNIHMVQHDSSNVAATGYDPESNILRVQFNNGSVYEYEGVPEEVAHGIHSASSVGEYVSRHVTRVLKGKQIHPTRPAKGD